MECGGKFMKIVVIVINVIFMIFGIVALALGIWALVDGDSLSLIGDILTSDVVDIPYLLRSAAILLCVIGAFVLIVSIFGCIGAIKDNRCLLIAYASILILILILQVTAIILVAVFQDKVFAEVKQKIIDKLGTTYDGVAAGQTDEFNIAFDKIQQKFECCGVNDYNDFTSDTVLPKWNASRGSETIPKMCCVLQTNNYPTSVTVNDVSCTNGSDATLAYINKGCFDAIKEEIKSKSLIVYIVGGFILFIEVIGVTFACCLCVLIGKENYVV